MQNINWVSEIEKLAREAGEIVRRGFHSVKTISVKSSAMDIVTEYDTEVEAFLGQAIRSKYPDHYVLGEEEEYRTKGSMGSKLPNRGYVWVIDPIDGTLNFAYGIPLLAVSLALYKDGKILAGVVYNPIIDEMFTAEKGKGSTCNGKRLEVSSVRRLEHALVGVSLGRRKKDPQLHRLVEKTGGMRALGTAAIALAYVAAGRLEAYWEKDLNLWDVAAGILLVQEAGGEVKILNQDDGIYIKDIEIIAACRNADAYLQALNI